MDDKHLRSCIPTHYGRVCAAKGPVSMVTGQECEPELLLNPHPDVLRSCEIMISTLLPPQWQYLEMDESWLYALHKEETIRITYPGKSYYIPSLKGMGILRMANGCSARTTSVELSGNENRAAKTQYIYVPEMRLNLMNIHPELWHHINITRSQDPENNNLDSIVSQMKEVGAHTRTTTFTHNLVYGGIAAQSMLSLIASY